MCLALACDVARRWSPPGVNSVALCSSLVAQRSRGDRRGGRSVRGPGEVHETPGNLFCPKHRVSTKWISVPSALRGSRRRVPPPSPPTRVQSPKPIRMWKTPGHLCCPLTSLLRHPRTPTKRHSVSSVLREVLRRVALCTVGQIWRRRNRKDPTVGGGPRPAPGSLAPSPAAALAALAAKR